MAKKRRNSTPQYYVYYDKRTGGILSVSNEQDTSYEYEFKTTYESVRRFISGEWEFKDYLIGYKRLADDETQLSIIPKFDEEYAFRNNVYEWIKPIDTESEVIVSWCKHRRVWEISLSETAKQSYNDGILSPRLVFFVTLETDFDFLINTIYVDVQSLITQEKIVVPFSSVFEEDISKISIGSRLVFKTYSLRVINE